jgi:hypothetical protein
VRRVEACIHLPSFGCLLLVGLTLTTDHKCDHALRCLTDTRNSGRRDYRIGSLPTASIKVIVMLRQLKQLPNGFRSRPRRPTSSVTRILCAIMDMEPGDYICTRYYESIQASNHRKDASCLYRGMIGADVNFRHRV